jgi:hydrogenase maturation protease
MTPRLLIAGIGNIFLGDDAFGVEVVQRLAQRPQPEGVQVVDFGIRGFDLAYTLMAGLERAILVDALPRGGAPGTLYVLEPGPDDLEGPEGGAALIDTHALHPLRVLRLVRELGGVCPPLYVVGCEPASLGSEEEPALCLSDPVRAAVDVAVCLVEHLVAKTLQGSRAAAPERIGS